MPNFTTAPTDPYAAFIFRVKWDGAYVAGVSEVSPLRRYTDVITYRAGGDPSQEHKIPGLTRYDAIELRRGVTADPAFEAWANQVWQLDANLGNEVSLADYRKDIVIDVYNLAGQLTLAYKVYRCWVSQYEALAELDALTGAISVQMIRIENEGWERDTAVMPPSTPTSTTPTSTITTTTSTGSGTSFTHADLANENPSSSVAGTESKL